MIQMRGGVEDKTMITKRRRRVAEEMKEAGNEMEEE